MTVIKDFIEPLMSVTTVPQGRAATSTSITTTR